MPRHITFSPLFQWISVLMGFLAGSLVVAGIASPFGLALQVILFFLGVFVFIDAIIPEGHLSIVAAVLSTVLGGVATLLITIQGISAPWTAIVVVVTILLYFIKFSKKRKKSKPPEKPQGKKAD